MQTLILTLHIIVCFLLVILILLQSGKEGMGVIFGGGNSSVFGSTGAGGILAKLTTLMAVIFVITSLSYTYVTSSHTEKESAVLNVQIEEPAAPKSTAPDTSGTSPENGAVVKPGQNAAPESLAPPPPSETGKAKEGAPAEANPEKSQSGAPTPDESGAVKPKTDDAKTGSTNEDNPIARPETTKPQSADKPAPQTKK